MALLRHLQEILRLLFSFFVEVIFPPRTTQRVVRETTFEKFASLVSPQFVPMFAEQNATGPAPNFVAVSLLPYRMPIVQAFVLEAKFHRNKKAQEFLGKLLATYFQKLPAHERCSNYFDHESLDPRRYLLVPLPLGKARRRERGYNQVEEVAKFVVSSIKTESLTEIFSVTLAANILVRTRETAPQTTLARGERLENMRGAFKVTVPLDPEVTYIVLDDVLTTGATLHAANEALKSAGAVNVFCIALAH